MHQDTNRKKSSLLGSIKFQGGLFKVFLLDKVSFEHYKRLIHRHTWYSQWSRVCNAFQGVLRHGQPARSFLIERSNTVHYSRKDGLTSILMFKVLEAKIFQYDFLEGQWLCDKITITENIIEHNILNPIGARAFSF